MPNETDERDAFPPAELARLYALYDGCVAGGGPASPEIQARDKVIRTLVQEIRRARARLERPSVAVIPVRSEAT